MKEAVAENESKKSTELHNLLTRLLKSLIKKDRNQFFLLPVSDAYAPGYSQIISQPMCFEKMQEKLDQRQYHNLQQFKDDLELICRNSCTYNAVGTIYYVEAQKLQQYGEKLISSYISSTASYKKGGPPLNLSLDSPSKNKPSVTQPSAIPSNDKDPGADYSALAKGSPASYGLGYDLPSQRPVPLYRQKTRRPYQKTVVEQDPSDFFKFDPTEVHDQTLEAYQKVHDLVGSQPKVYQLDLFSRKILRCRSVDPADDQTTASSTTIGSSVAAPYPPFSTFPMDDFYLSSKTTTEAGISHKLDDLWLNSEFAMLQRELLDGTHEELCTMVQIFGSLVGACYSLNMLTYIDDCTDPMRRMVIMLLDTITDKKNSEFIKQKTTEQQQEKGHLFASCTNDLLVTVQSSLVDQRKKETLLKAICKIRSFLRTLLQNNWRLIEQICSVKSVDSSVLTKNVNDLADSMKQILSTIKAIPPPASF